MKQKESWDFQDGSAEKWVENAKQGDSEAFGRIYSLFFKKIYCYLYYRCLHRETAEDLTSQVFLRALEKLSTFRAGEGTFFAWMYGIAHNALVDFYRSRVRTLDVATT